MKEAKKENVKVKFKDKTPLQKAWIIISTTIVSLFAAVAVVFLVSAITMKVSGHEALTIGNTEIRLVLTGSMEWGENTPDSHKGYAIGNINTNDAVFIEKAPEDEAGLKTFCDGLAIGDVVTINYVESGKMITITHRLVGKDNWGNGYRFIIQGDNYSEGTPGYQYVYTATDAEHPNPFPLNSFVGKVTKVSPFLGWFMSASKNKVVIICLVLAPAAAVIVYEVVKIIIILNNDRKERFGLAVAESSKKSLDTHIENVSSEDEIERLKKMLAEKEAELKKKNNEGDK